MLNEVFKGMDNAAEVINDNFKNGSVVENGENENGSYVKFGNGLQICWRRQSVTTDVNNGTGTVRVSDDLTWEYPVAFSKAPSTQISVTNGYSPAPFWENVRNVGASTSTYRIVTVWSAGFSSVGFIVNSIAIGRWKE